MCMTLGCNRIGKSIVDILLRHLVNQFLMASGVSCDQKRTLTGGRAIWASESLYLSFLKA